MRIIGGHDHEQRHDADSTRRTAVALYRRLPSAGGHEYLYRLLAHDRGDQRLVALYRGGETLRARALTGAARSRWKRETLPALWGGIRVRSVGGKALLVRGSAAADAGARSGRGVPVPGVS